MSNDPLASFRRPLPEGWQNGQEQDVLTEHEALRLAIDAFHQMPDSRLAGEYPSTYHLLPVLEAAYNNAERELAKEDQYWNAYFEQHPPSLQGSERGIEPER